MRVLLLSLLLSTVILSTKAQSRVDFVSGDVGYEKTGNTEVFFTFADPLIDILYSDSASTVTSGIPPIFIEQVSTSSQEVAQIDGINLFPNPAGDVINIDIPNRESAHIVSVIDQTGRTLLSLQVPVGTGRDQIDIASLTSGTYLVQVIDSDGAMGLFRFVKMQN